MNITEVILLILVFFLHLIGDFVLQTRKMAENKSKSIKYLTYHVLSYCIPFLILFFGFVDKIEYLYFIFLLFTTHWITDFITSKITTHYWQHKKIHAFFLTIGFDQFIHAATLIILTYSFIY